jgi:hypothetical protein
VGNAAVLLPQIYGQGWDSEEESEMGVHASVVPSPYVDRLIPPWFI